MLTIDDIRNSTRNSGFEHVAFVQDKRHTDNFPYQSYSDEPQGRVYGRRRATAELAAQDYCDYINKQLTIESIRNSRRNSGFNHVSQAGRPGPNGGGGGTAWYATLRTGVNKSGNSGVLERGPRRATPEEAAQDYCDYINKQKRPATPASHSYPQPTVDMGTDTEHAPAEPTVQIKRRRYEGPHDVYDVYIYDAETGAVIRRKAGITARGEKRYADIAKTFGFSIRPVVKAVTYPSKSAALKAERERIAAIAADETNWRPVAKEAFAPRVPMNIKMLTESNA